MASLRFSIVEKGYSMSEVEKYIEMLQSEYSNAVEWSNEIEKKLDGIKSAPAYEAEISMLRDENEKLLSDCKLLASKLRKMTGNPKESDSEKADEVITAANIKAESIIDEARKNCDSLIENANARLEQLKAETEKLSRQKARLESEAAKLNEMKSEVLNRLEQAMSILDF